jgi:hypothetical protein
MNCDAFYIRMSPADLDEIISDDEQLEQLPVGFHDPDLMLSLHKYWRTLHLILTGRECPYSPEAAMDDPMSMAIVGGEMVGPDLGYGPARYLSVEQVKEIALALESIDFDQLVDEYSVDDIDEDELSLLDNLEEEKIELKEVYFPEFKYFFRQAARNGEVVLAYIA